MKRKNMPCLFGEVLVSSRKERGVTQYELAKRTGISERYLNALEHGMYEPGAAKLIQLAAALGMRPGELLDAYAERLQQKTQEEV